MPGENGDESQHQTSEEIEYHIEVIFLLHQSRPLVHEGREGGESSAEPRGEQQFGRWRHPSPFPPVQSREKPDDEASRHIHRHGSERKGNHRAGLHHLGNPISHAASEEAADTYYQYFFHLLI